MKLRVIYAIVIAIFALGIGLGMDSCTSRIALKNAIAAKVRYEHKVDHYRSKNGQLVASNKSLETSMEVLELTNDSLVEYFENIRIKRPETVVIYDTEIKLDTVRIPISIPCDSTFSFPFSAKSLHYRISGSVTNNTIILDEVQFPNRATVTTGIKKTGLFKKETIVAITNSNPYMEVQGISSYTFPDQRKWYQKGWPKFVIGGIGGAVLTYLIVK